MPVSETKTLVSLASVPVDETPAVVRLTGEPVTHTPLPVARSTPLVPCYPSPMPTFDGGCHCGAVRFRVTVEDLQPIIDCTCSICTKKGILHFIVPEERFSVLQGEDALVTYTFNTLTAKHLFCKTCGIHPFYRPRSHPTSWDVNARCLDDPSVVTRFPLQPFDGRNWEASVESIR